jgi:hypothetical protein
MRRKRWRHSIHSQMHGSGQQMKESVMLKNSLLKNRLVILFGSLMLFHPASFAQAADDFICMTPQITDHDRVTNVQMTKFLNRDGTVVLDRGGPVEAVTLEDFQLAFGGDAWQLSDSLPGGDGKIRIGVAFLDGNSFQKQAVIKYASEWLVPAGAGKVAFVFENNQRNHIRVTFNAPINFNQSMIGRQATLITDPAAPTMHLGDVREDMPLERVRSVIRHEFGHALGLRHEHQHPAGGIQWNKPVVLAELKRYGWDAQKVQRNIFDVFATSYMCQGAPNFDPRSIMMYPISAGWTLDGYTVGQNTQIIPGDLQCVHSLYR